jgi:enamine deaminase RidA (YjgF/YER057c/UK114 family)
MRRFPAVVTRPPLVFVGARGGDDFATAVAALATDVPLDRIARLGMYYDADAFPDRDAVLDALAAAFREGSRPAVSLVPVPPVPGRPAVAVEAVGGTGTVVRHGDGRVPDAVSCGGLVFTSAVLDPDPHADIAQQSRSVLTRLRSVLEAAGTTLGASARLNIFYVGGGTAEDWEVAARVRASFFDEPGPAATGIPVQGLGAPGALIAMELVAFADPPADRSYSWPAGHWDWTIHLPWKHGNAARGLAFVGGQVALTPDAEVIAPGDLPRQARIAAENIRRVLAELGFGLEDLVKLTAFVAGRPGDHAEVVPLDGDAGRLPAVTEVWLPFLAYEDMVVEIEAIAMRAST